MRRKPPAIGLEEALLLGLHHFLDVLALGKELGYTPPIKLDGAPGRCAPGSARGGPAPRRGRHGAPQDAAQHVAAAVARRIHAIGQQERHRARVIGEHAVGRAFGPALVRPAHDFDGALDQGDEEVGVEVRGHVLAVPRDTFESAPVSTDGLGSGTRAPSSGDRTA